MNRCVVVVNHFAVTRRGAQHVAVVEPCCGLARSRGAAITADIWYGYLLLELRPGSREPHNEHRSGCAQGAAIVWSPSACRSTLAVGKGGVGESSWERGREEFETLSPYYVYATIILGVVEFRPVFIGGPLKVSTS